MNENRIGSCGTIIAILLSDCTKMQQAASRKLQDSKVGLGGHYWPPRANIGIPATKYKLDSNLN